MQYLKPETDYHSPKPLPGALRRVNIDGFVKSPSAALRFNFVVAA